MERVWIRRGTLPDFYRAQGLPARDLTLGTAAAAQSGARVARGAGLQRPGA